MNFVRTSLWFNLGAKEFVGRSCPYCVGCHCYIVGEYHIRGDNNLPCNRVRTDRYFLYKIIFYIRELDQIEYNDTVMVYQVGSFPEVFGDTVLIAVNQF